MEVKVEDTKPVTQGIEVNLEKEKAGKAQEEPRYVTIEKLEEALSKAAQKQSNSISYIGRQVETLLKRFDETSKVSVTPIGAVAKDNYDELLEKGDWRTPITSLARDITREELQKAIQIQREEETKRQSEANKVTALESSKKKVLDRYPDLADSNSDLSTRYMTVLNSHQEYLTNEYGPLLAMRDMEDELRNEGRLDEYSKKAVDKEVERRARTQASVLPRVTRSSPKTIVLSREQKEYCDHNNMDYAEYAKSVRMMNESSQVEVSNG